MVEDDKEKIVVIVIAESHVTIAVKMDILVVIALNLERKVPVDK